MVAELDAEEACDAWCEIRRPDRRSDATSALAAARDDADAIGRVVTGAMVEMLARHLTDRLRPHAFDRSVAVPGEDIFG